MQKKDNETVFPYCTFKVYGKKTQSNIFFVLHIVLVLPSLYVSVS